MNSIRKSLAISFATRYTELIIQFFTSIIIAHLLTPRELGIFSVSAILVGMAQVLREFGIGQYIIHEKDLTRDGIRSALGVALIIAWGVAALMLAIGPYAADFYHEPGVRSVILILALNFFLVPFGAITMAYLRRRMEFGVLYRVNVASAIAHAVVAVGMAAMGFAYLSLAWASVAGVAVSILMVTRYRPAGFPYLPRFRELGKVITFGGYAGTASVMDEIGTFAPDLIIGRVMDMHAVGLFSRAGGLVQIFNRFVTSAIWPVVLPHFTAKHRAGRSIKYSYLRAVSYVTGLAWPFFVFLALMAYPAVRILFGPQWDASVPIVRILCLEGAFAAGIFFSTQVFISVGRVSRSVSFQVKYQLIKIIAIVVAVPFGLSAVAAALALSTMIGLIIVYLLLDKLINVSFREFIATTLKSAQVAVISSAVPMTVLLGFDIGPGNVLLPFVTALAGFISLWVVAVFLTDHPLKDEFHSAWSHIRDVHG